MEQQLGERLRLARHRGRYESEGYAAVFDTELHEMETPVRVGMDTLAEWYFRYHPDAGPVRYESAQRLEDALGPHLRQVYPGCGYKVLKLYLSRRRERVLVTDQTARTGVRSSQTQQPGPGVRSSPLRPMYRRETKGSASDRPLLAAM